MDVEDARSIGERARKIRRRHGLSLDVVAGISASYLSMLERGQRGFNRRGLLDDLAAALGDVRPDPMARDLILTLDRRAPHRVWELDSLRNRFGVGRLTSRKVRS